MGVLFHTRHILPFRRALYNPCSSLKFEGKMRIGSSSHFSSSASGKRLEGKVAIVTASTEGIGHSIASRFARDGAKVMISSRKKENVDKALKTHYANGVSSENIKGIVCHVAKGDDRVKLIETTVKEFGAIDILVSNAASNPYFGPTLNCPESAWDKMFETNVKAGFLLAKEVQPYMIQRNGGSIVYISSIAGFQPFQLLGPYSVTKTALLGLTKVMAQELAHDKIRVNCVAPGIIDTKFSTALTSNKEILEKMMEVVPMGRVGKPDEVAGIVSFLASDDASFITGESFVVAGGQNSRL